MKNVYAISLIGLLAGCNAPSELGSSFSSSEQNSSANTSTNVQTQDSNSGTTQQMKQRYLYILVGGKVQTFPIDSSTGELIQPVTGNWVVSAGAAGDFYTMVMNPNGKNLYVLLRNTSLASKIYQYSIQDNSPYSEYGTDRPLSAMSPATVTTNINPLLFSFGNNGNLFLQNNTSTPKVDSYSINSSTGALSSPTVLVGSETYNTPIYGLSFTRVIQVGFDAHTYYIDSQTNRVIHYIDGVIQSSFQVPQGPGTQYELKELALH